MHHVYIIKLILLKKKYSVGNILYNCVDSAIKSLLVQQNLTVRICMNEKEIHGLTSLNYKSCKVLPVWDLYKLSAILFVSNTHRYFT